MYNSRDPVSSELASYYAGKRSIPADQLIGLETSIEEQISREEYDSTIAEPLKRIFLERGWWRLEASETGTQRVSHSDMRFVVLIRGIPLKIAQTNSYPGDRGGHSPELATNEASVDSELAALGSFSRQISGLLPNPYFRSFTPALDFNSTPVLLVTRLDAPTASLVRQMIDNALQAEQTGLRGSAYIDQRSIQEQGFKTGDQWLANAAKSARKAGMPVIMDKKPELFAAAYPMRDVAIYYGWYAKDVTGPFASPDFSFATGAVACHIHSFSAASLRDPVGGWAGPLLMRGATAVLGNVFEPYLLCTAELDLFHDRLVHGFTLAESAYAATRFVSWMPVVIGDPLYRPFAVWHDLAAAPKADQWEAYRKGAILWSENRPDAEAALREASSAFHTGFFLESLGLLQAEANHSKSALRSFSNAQDLYTDVSDKVRCAIHAAQLLEQSASAEVILKFLGQQIRSYPNAPATIVLRDMERKLRENTPARKTTP